MEPKDNGTYLEVPHKLHFLCENDTFRRVHFSRHLEKLAYSANTRLAEMNLKAECWELVHGAEAYVSILRYHIETCTKKIDDRG